jgi:glycosyltransferase involved in cell wall biosynthesis
MKKLQIHVPVYNEEENLPKFIDSALTQSFRDVEFIFHDNHSTDRTLELIQHYSKFYSNCFYKTYPKNAGAIVQNFRVMYSARDSEFIGMRSANDLMENTYLESVMDLLETNPEIGLAYSHGKSFNSTDESWSYISEAKIDTRGKNKLDSAIDVISKYTEPFSFWGVFRNEVYSKIQPYRYCHGGDHIFICEAALYGGIASTDEALDTHFIHPSQVGYGGIQKNAQNQMEEQSRDVDPESLFYGIKHMQPFSDMAFGHVEMLALALISEVEKFQLCELAISVLKQRFKAHIEYENKIFLNFLDQSINHIEKISSIPQSVLHLWKSKAHREIEKIHLVGNIPFEVLASYRDRLDKLKKVS